MGSSAYDASAGASSVLVHVSFIYVSECRESAICDSGRKLNPRIT
jgi:hypothetical protein